MIPGCSARTAFICGDATDPHDVHRQPIGPRQGCRSECHLSRARTGAHDVGWRLGEVATLAAVALVLMLLLGGCKSSSGTGTPVEVSVAQLAAEQSAYAGKDVRTRGVVRMFADPEGDYYVVEDSLENRVELMPASSATSYADQQVTVIGRFDVDPNVGRVIKITEIRANP